MNEREDNKAMSETQALAVRNEAGLQAISITDLTHQVALIQQMMKSVMKEKEHYGTIPGCGPKPTLLKPGAEKLCFTFRLAPKYTVEEEKYPNGHKDFKVMCSLLHIPTSAFVGEGSGSCSTMEGKYRYRVAPKKLTDRPVPKEYWNLKKSDPAAAQQAIGGKGFSVKKDDFGNWMIAEGTDEKVEHDNPADYYNTCRKMACKRALVAAVLTSTAASDIFTQDIEEMVENGSIIVETAPPVVQEARPAPMPPPKPKPVPAPKEVEDDNIPFDYENDKKGEGWRDVEIHFGKQKGTKLGDLRPESLKWWIEHFEPKPWPEGSNRYKDADLAFRKALNEAQKEVESVEVMP